MKSQTCTDALSGENQLWQSVIFITTRKTNFADDGTSIKRYYSKPLVNEVVTRYTTLVYSVELAKHSLANHIEPGIGCVISLIRVLGDPVNLSQWTNAARSELITTWNRHVTSSYCSRNSEVGTVVVNYYYILPTRHSLGHTKCIEYWLIVAPSRPQNSWLSPLWIWLSL